MTPHAGLGAIVQLTLLLGVVAMYVLLARRFRLLWQPCSILVAVASVSVVVAVLGVLLFGGGWTDVPAMMRRSAIGGVGWGLVIAVVVWVCRGAFTWWTKLSAP